MEIEGFGAEANGIYVRDFNKDMLRDYKFTSNGMEVPNLLLWGTFKEYNGISERVPANANSNSLIKKGLLIQCAKYSKYDIYTYGLNTCLQKGERNIAVKQLEDDQVINGRITIEKTLRIIHNELEHTDYDIVGVNAGLRNNQQLREITFKAKPEMMSPAPFAGCNITKLTLPIEMYKSLINPQSRKLDEIKFEDVIGKILEGTTAKNVEIVFQDSSANKITKNFENTPTLLRSNIGSNRKR